MSAHAYAHLIGSNLGIGIAGVGVVAATVMTPEVGQDDNDLLVSRVDTGEWSTVKYMDTYRIDFVNASQAEPR